ncbi:hypothetical protein FCL47_22300 [Desulfopila sp. IMCC35006]|uniref:MJ0042-type zinc finger domain-containing protein n=1 Tax=Desulfopila sp. IMCC35006 TaxID=2569542 RepID=UPI0010AD40B8|nr:hypothetical protein FCL47_22300 [Desulfopila sp. IMCC35006]
MHIEVCEKCGARYELTSISLPVRDKDNIKCNYCGTIIYSWSGGCTFNDKELSGPSKEYEKD